MKRTLELFDLVLGHRRVSYWPLQASMPSLPFGKMLVVILSAFLLWRFGRMKVIVTIGSVFKTLGETNNILTPFPYGSDDLTLKVWVTESVGMQSGGGFAPWRHLCTLTGYHDQTIFSVHWSREGIFASGATDDAIRLLWMTMKVRLVVLSTSCC